MSDGEVEADSGLLLVEVRSGVGDKEGDDITTTANED